MFYINSMNKFAERLRELRADADMSRATLAEKLNVSERLISYWENGKRECDFDMLIRISELFSSSVDYLLGRVDY